MFTCTCVCVSTDACVEVRRQPEEVGFLSPVYKSRELNTGHHIWPQVLFPAETSCWPSSCFFISCLFILLAFLIKYICLNDFWAASQIHPHCRAASSLIALSYMQYVLLCLVHAKYRLEGRFTA